jgi:hypothetical protein
LIQLISTGKACIKTAQGEVPASAGASFEVETQAQADRLIAKGYAEPAGASEEPQEPQKAGKRTKKEG